MKTVLAALALVALVQSSWATSVQGKCKEHFKMKLLKMY